MVRVDLAVWTHPSVALSTSWFKDWQAPEQATFPHALPPLQLLSSAGLFESKLLPSLGASSLAQSALAPGDGLFLVLSVPGIFPRPLTFSVVRVLVSLREGLGHVFIVLSPVPGTVPGPVLYI